MFSNYANTKGRATKLPQALGNHPRNPMSDRAGIIIPEAGPPVTAWECQVLSYILLGFNYKSFFEWKKKMCASSCPIVPARP